MFIEEKADGEPFEGWQNWELLDSAPIVSTWDAVVFSYVILPQGRGEGGQKNSKKVP